MTLDDLQGKKIALLGLGVNHQYLAEFFKRQRIGFQVFQNWSSFDELLGKLDDFDVVFRTPGLPYLAKPIQQARENGVIIYSQTKLFFDLCPGKIAGITGTKGKGTTASLLSKILEAGNQRAWLGGNIGTDPFAFLDKVQKDDWVVLELSSFQLQDLHHSPTLAVVLKITPEHLDHHHTFAEYVDAKSAIVRFQKKGDFAVLNYDNEVCQKLSQLTSGTVWWNSIVQEVKPGCFVKDQDIYLSEHKVLMPISEVKLLGRFNLENVTAAATAAIAVGMTDTRAIRKAVSEFSGLPHRLEFVREIRGVQFFNDSFSTTPETAIAAISAFSKPLILIIGGSEKKADYQGLTDAIIKQKIKAFLAIGVTGSKIAKAASAKGFQGQIIEKKFSDMEEIIIAANQVAKAGDIVLLSPGSASFDLFKNYKDRGEQFRKAVNNL